MLRFHFLDVGNGDSIVLEHSDEAGNTSFGLIDCNRTPARKSPARDKLLSLGAERLNFVFLTHPDTDHFSGLYDALVQYRGKIDRFGTYPFEMIYRDEALLRKYFEKVVKLSTIGGDPDVARQFLELLQIIKFAYDELIDVWVELSGNYDRLDVPGFIGVEFHSIMPPKKVKAALVQNMLEGQSLNGPADHNAISAAIAVKYAGKTIILSGDAPAEHWEAHSLYRDRQNIDLRSAAIKLPHHGSKYDNTLRGLETLIIPDETFSIISADGRRHPDLETFVVLDQLRAKRLCTGLSQPFAKLKKLSAMTDLSPRLSHYVNVYADVDDSDAVHCKGDITISILPNGDVVADSQFNTVCNCTTSLDDLFA